jgi:HAD superfamily hydrolase (TIGR01549 family)
MLLDENELFIFDWDGTLATSGALIRVSKMLKARYKLGYILKHKERYKVRSVNDLVIKEETGKLVSTIYALYSRLSMVRLKPGSEEILKLLKENKKKVCIFSDSNTTRLMAETRSTNVVKYADFILSADSINRYKPDPSGILLIMDKYRMKKDKAVYIGDMASDVYASRFAGVKACIVADGLDPVQLIKDAKPDYFFASTTDMLDNLRRKKAKRASRRR